MRIDRNKLLELTSGDNALADKFIQGFKEQVANQLVLMNKYLDEENYELISNSAHIVKTQTAYMGLSIITELAERVEHDSVKVKSKDELKIMIAEIQNLVFEVIRAEKI